MASRAIIFTALTRMLALSIAQGDKEKAQEYLDWASSGKVTEKPVRDKVGERTRRFIEYYLDPNLAITSSTLASFISRYINAKMELDYDAVQEEILNMDYQSFLRTAYWAAIATYVKGKAGKKCEVCGATDVKLKAIRRHFDNYGRDLLHLEDFKCVCEKCHAEIYNKRDSI